MRFIQRLFGGGVSESNRHDLKERFDPLIDEELRSIASDPNHTPLARQAAREVLEEGRPAHRRDDTGGVDTSVPPTTGPVGYSQSSSWVPDPQTAAVLLGEAVGAASDDLLNDVAGGAAFLIAEAVVKAGGIARDEAIAIGILAGTKAGEVARATGHGKGRRVEIAKKVAILAASVGQGCQQHKEPDAGKKAVDMVLKELSKPEPEGENRGGEDSSGKRVVVGNCEACGRPLRVKRRGVRSTMRLTCKCSRVNVLQRISEISDDDVGT